MVKGMGLLGLLSLVLAGLTPPHASAGKGAEGLRGLTLKVEQVSRPVYPYQAVRLRLTVHNAGKKRVGPLEFYPGKIEIWIKGPRDKTYQRLWEVFPRDPDRFTGEKILTFLEQ